MATAMAALCANVATGGLFLSVIFVSGALDACSYRPGLVITAPKMMEALNGSCLQIPCTFQPTGHFENKMETFGAWYKIYYNIPEYVVFNSSGTVKRYPMDIIGNLREKNCTTMFYNLTPSYTDTYYFRVMNWPYRASAICDPLQINVTDSAPKPKIGVSVDERDLKENDEVTISCSAPTPCPLLPPRLTWTLQPDAHSQTQPNSDGTLRTKLQTRFTLSDADDGKSIICSARYPVDGGEREETSVVQKILSVSYAPKDTQASISPSAVVSPCSLVNLSCSSRAKPPISSFSWFKNTEHGALLVAREAWYSFNATNMTGRYYCVAENLLGSQKSTEILLTVEGQQSTTTNLHVVIILKILGIIILCSTITIFECWFRLKFHKTPVKDTQENVYVNTVMKSWAK